jgi:hypothetical protein
MPAHVADPWNGQCLHFDGLDDRVLLEGAIVPVREYTLECWVKPESPPAGNHSGQVIAATAGGALVLSLDAQYHPRATRKGGDRWYGIAGRSAVTLRAWQHLAVSFDGAMLRLFRNGVLEGQIAAPGVAGCGEVAVGYNSVTNSSFYCGCLDELRLCARALPPAEFGPHNPLKQPRPDTIRP